MKCRPLLVLMITALAVIAALAPEPVSAGKSCAGCPVTTVSLNPDGTATVATGATPTGGCIGAVSPTKYACNVRVYTSSSVSAFGTDGGPTVVSYSGCPCTAQFWVHAGQWQPYSAMSDPWG